MMTFGSGMSTRARADEAAREAAERARASLGGETPKIAIVFASPSYGDISTMPRAIRSVLGSDIFIIGGTAGGTVFSSGEVGTRGVSVVALAGDDIDVAVRTAPASSALLVEAVPAAEQIARQADEAALRGFPHFACLVFAPGSALVDGEALVAAVRKGAGARAQLAGGLTGDDLTFDRSMVIFGDEVWDNRIVITGLFTRRPIGIAARHGWRAVGPVRRVTRTDGIYVVTIDDRPALDVWLEDARAAGATPPPPSEGLALYLANHYSVGLIDASTRKSDPAHLTDRRELVVRAPFSIREDGALQLSATIPEGRLIRVLHATEADLLLASGDAAEAAVQRVGGPVAGALILACSGRLAALGKAFPEEPAAIHRRVAAPVGGACVFGEIARNVRDADAFFNTTAVVVAFGA